MYWYQRTGDIVVFLDDPSCCQVVTPALNEITSQHPKLWWLEKLEGEMVGCAPILHLDEVFADPHVQFLGAWLLHLLL